MNSSRQPNETEDKIEGDKIDQLLYMMTVRLTTTSASKI